MAGRVYINSAESMYNADVYMQIQSSMFMTKLVCFGLGSWCNGHFLSTSRHASIVKSGICAV